MWEINDEDSTAYISRYFEEHMKSELGKARVRFQKNLKKKLVKKVMKEATSQNGLSASLRKGVSQDVLVMVSKLLKLLPHYYQPPHICVTKDHVYFTLGG